jgi:RNA polymerase sigma factor (TIGR02999 family)
MGDITQILQAVERGENSAERLLPLVYEELRKLAAHKMAHEAAGQTLQPTALVHEAWLRLPGSDREEWNNRTHFFMAAAEAMRRILIDTARRKRSLKRGSGNERVELHDSHIAQSGPDDELLAVHEALDLLAESDAVAANLVKLRYFVGMTMPEAAAALGMPLRTAGRLWAYARAWLRRELER